MNKDLKHSDYAQKTYIVTGSAGFIGYYTACALLDAGAVVIGIDNLNDYYDVSLKEQRLSLLQKYENFTFYKQDIADAGAVLSIFTKYKPDIVIHLAAQAGVRYSLENPDAYTRSNLIGFMSVLTKTPTRTFYICLIKLCLWKRVG